MFRFEYVLLEVFVRINKNDFFKLFQSFKKMNLIWVSR